ncbi:MAG: XRE family transcriptional regulator [Bacillota bacterium]
MEFAERLKRMRINSGLSVRALAERVGVSASFIYQLEKGETSPSFSTLRRLADVFSSSISVFLEDQLPDDWVIVRHDRRKQIITGDPACQAELMLFLGSRAKRMQPVVIRLAPGGTISDFIYQHQRDDLIYLCRGSLEIVTGGKSYILEAGDAAYFTFVEPESIRNNGPEEAEFLWVVSPPSADS